MPTEAIGPGASKRTITVPSVPFISGCESVSPDLWVSFPPFLEVISMKRQPVAIALVLVSIAMKRHHELSKA